jgi:outer membrane lipopolysaccharide assembly protein LptE/RlpB
VKKSPLLFLFLLIPVVLSICGCGYRLTSDPNLPSPIAGKKISIPVFANKSYRANLGAIVAGSLVEEFARRSGGRVVTEEGADLLLTGTVISYSSNPVSYSAFDRVREYRATITVEAVLTEKSTRKVVWKGTIPWSQDYPVSRRKAVFLNITGAVQQTDVALQQNSEEAAIREICAKLAQQFYERIAAGF